MTIVDPSELLTASSGSLGEIVFSRNQHGPYLRARTFPTDPATARQAVVRAALAECVNAWKNTLTAAERRAWDTYALAVPLRTALGRATNPGGLASYIRANVPRLQAAVGGVSRVDQAPTSHNLGSYTPIQRVVLNFNDDTIHPFFTDSDAWVDDTGAAMLFYASAPKPLTRNFWRGPYRYAGPLIGGDPQLSSPGTIPLPAGATVNQRVFVQGRVTQADARLSHTFRLPADAVAQVAPLPISAIFTPLPPPLAQARITFDALLRRQPHFPLNWTVRFGNSVWTVATAFTLRDAIVLRLRNTGILLGPDFVAYAPPPFDVNGLLTGIPVAGFNIPLTL